MKKIICEMCGSADLVKQNGVFVCQSCGCQYSVEEAKRMMVEVEGTVSVQGSVQIDKSSDVQKYLANARRALEKEDWEDVERYYNLVEENDPTDIEAIFYSTYGKAKQTLTSDDFYKREQIFKSLIKSISIIDDNFNLAKEQDQKEIIIKINKAILDMASSAYVYTEVRNGYGEFKDSNSIKTRQLFNDLQSKFIETVKNIITKYKDEKQKTYLYTIILDQCNFILQHGQLEYPGIFRVRRLFAVKKLRMEVPDYFNDKGPTYVFKNKEGESCAVSLIFDSIIELTVSDVASESFQLCDSFNDRVEKNYFSAEDIDYLDFDTTDTGTSLKMFISEEAIGNASIAVDKEQFELLRELFETLSEKCLSYNVRDIDNFSLSNFLNDQQINKKAVMGLPVERVSFADMVNRDQSEISLNSDGTISVKNSKGIDEKLNYWDITHMAISKTGSLSVSGDNTSGKKVTLTVTCDEKDTAEMFTIVQDIRLRILACGNKRCSIKGLGSISDKRYPGATVQFEINYDGKTTKIILDKSEIILDTRGDMVMSYGPEKISYESISCLSRPKGYSGSLYIRYVMNSIPAKKEIPWGGCFKGILVNEKDAAILDRLAYELALRINYCKKIHGIEFYTREEIADIKKMGLASSAILVEKGACYVATAVYGSYDCPQVWTLRRYRDEVLGSTWHGRLFIKLYYAISPTLVKWFGKTKWFQKMWKGKLDKMVGELNAKGFEDTPYQDKDWK